MRKWWPSTVSTGCLFSNGYAFSICPPFFVASLGLCFKVIIAAEVLSQPRYGIGTIFQIERARLNTAGVMALCILLIVLAALFEAVFQRTGAGISGTGQPKG